MDVRAIIAVGIGAAVGGILRYIIGNVFIQGLGPGFPWGTLFINVTGSFFIGIIAQLASTRAFGVTPMVRIFAATGVLGGYTTFSTFSLDTITLVTDGTAVAAVLYAFSSLAIGALGTYAGQLLVRIAGG